MKKWLLLIATASLWICSMILPTNAANVGAGWFGAQNPSTIWVASADKGGQWGTGFIDFVQAAVNWILWFLALITIIILIWGGFQMITAAWDEGKYKKWFTIVKQANLIFSFMNTNTTTAGWGWATWMIQSQSKLA